MEATASPIIVVSQPRSGSTWVCDRLSVALPQYLVLCEMFLRRPRPLDWAEQPNAYLLCMPRFHEWRAADPERRSGAGIRDYLTWLLTQQPARGVSFKVMYRQVLTNPGLLAWVFNRGRVIHLFRRNALEVVVSRAQMRQSAPHAVESGKRQPVRLDPWTLPVRILLLQLNRWLWSAALRAGGARSVAISYEALRNAPDRVTAEVLRALGEDDANVGEGRLVRPSNEPVSQRVTNPAQVRRALRLLGARWMLDG